MTMRICALVALLLAALLVLLCGGPAQAGVTLAACPTILDSLYVDWRSTRALFDRCGAACEGNPIVRLTGPDLYFGWGMISTGLWCRETPGWRLYAVGVWAVQTWAVNTHGPWGTMYRPPLLQFTVRW